MATTRPALCWKKHNAEDEEAALQDNEVKKLVVCRVRRVRGKNSAAVAIISHWKKHNARFLKTIKNNYGESKPYGLAHYSTWKLWATS